MKLSPLQLEHSQFTAFSVVVNKLPSSNDEVLEGSYPAITPADISTKIELGIVEDPENNKFIVTVGVNSTEEAVSSLPYRFAVQMEGFFTLESEEDIELRKRLVVINGASMLFGTIREHLLSMTLRHKNGPIFLPSLDFRALNELKREDGTSDKVPMRRTRTAKNKT